MLILKNLLLVSLLYIEQMNLHVLQKHGTYVNRWT